MSRDRCGWRVLLGALSLASTLFLAAPAQAAEPVDVELALAVDVSLSMSPMELEIQRRGYASALTDDSVLKAIAQGAYGKIAVTYFEWAGSSSHHVIVPWTVIAGREDAERIAARLSDSVPNSARRTSVSAALEFGADLFAESPFKGMKRVIDISGDGPNNQGGPVEAARDAVVKQGIVINGLPLMTSGGFNGGYDIRDLNKYYADCVIGGPGAFMIPVNDWSQFPAAVRRKLVLELAGPLSPVWKAVADGTAPVWRAQATKSDCLIGEKGWRDRDWMWDSPPR
ncbi:MAG: DUF1194 domain-containing protein [Rhizobiaceae bacterium]